ncbi:MAG: response regulator transcription factor [Ezakiella sp.]|nr:response regulator transcription factor [Ezakiella sp.]MDD7472496.1 winged helix-turn-helix domain-containing protein [Bacillota bacterium]MDY3923261.1 winged helix-turn-helix domain-containing protein [Ezakiella sp.]
MSSLVYVVDDEKTITDIVKFNLEKEGFEVNTYPNGNEALEAVYEKPCDLMLLDVMMPGLGGFEVLKTLRKTYTFPILMLTAKEEEVDKVLGLELGADDYIVKPYSMRELIARVKANLRRVQTPNISGDMQKYGDLVVDSGKYEATIDGESVNLTSREFELLKYLADNQGQVFTREQLLQEVWGYEYFGDIRTVDVTIRRLREKIENPGEEPKYIITKRGIGYYFGG